MNKPFITTNKVRMHDTDMAGILYFAKQFRFAHDALEEFVESEGISLDQVFKKEDFVFVIVHAEADYYKPLRVGDHLEIHLFIEHIGTSSFAILYHIYKIPDKELVGSVKTIHVSLENKTRKKIDIPDKLKKFLTKYLIE